MFLTCPPTMSSSLETPMSTFRKMETKNFLCSFHDPPFANAIPGEKKGDEKKAYNNNNDKNNNNNNDINNINDNNNNTADNNDNE